MPRGLAAAAASATAALLVVLAIVVLNPEAYRELRGSDATVTATATPPPLVATSIATTSATAVATPATPTPVATSIATPLATATHTPTATATPRPVRTPRPTVVPTPAPTPDCLVTGRVRDRDSDLPIVGAMVGLAEGHGDLLTIDYDLGLTDSSGDFAISCDGIASSSFPLAVLLTRSDWYAIWHTNTSIPVGGQTGLAIDLSLCQSLKPLGQPLATDVPADAGPTQLLTISTRGNYTEYDFQSGIVSTGTPPGDFYVSPCGEPTFWGNHNGPPAWQQGVIDLGDLGDTPLETISPPGAGYFQFGVPAIVGHTYVSKAREAFEGNHIVFRVVAVEFDGVSITKYVLEYYYREGN